MHEKALKSQYPSLLGRRAKVSLKVVIRAFPLPPLNMLLSPTDTVGLESNLHFIRHYSRDLYPVTLDKCTQAPWLQACRSHHTNTQRWVHRDAFFSTSHLFDTDTRCMCLSVCLCVLQKLWSTHSCRLYSHWKCRFKAVLYMAHTEVINFENEP